MHILIKADVTLGALSLLQKTMKLANSNGVEGLRPPKQKILEEVPPWVLVMLEIMFFQKCDTHLEIKDNKLDRFCIDCTQRFCSNCSSNHDGHRSIKIRRYVYCEVINRTDFRKHFNCSGIQGYKTNKAKVLFLKQRGPHEEVKQHQQQSVKDYSCLICNHSLLDSAYCSIQCKVSSLQTTKDQVGEALVDGLADSKEDLTLLSRKRQRVSRKGIAHRSHLF